MNIVAALNFGLAAFCLALVIAGRSSPSGEFFGAVLVGLNVFCGVLNLIQR